MEEVYFEGRRYARREGRRYFMGGRLKMLHRDVWASANGPIPAGHHIHHKDGNVDNNALSNLESLPASVHHSHHLKKRLSVPTVCQQCGKTYVSFGRKSDRFCSGGCKAAWRYHSGVDNETRVCARCAKEFVANRYARSKCCSHDCALRDGWTRRERK